MSLVMLEKLAASVPTPASGKSALYFESADSLPKYKDDAGTVFQFAVQEKQQAFTKNQRTVPVALNDGVSITVDAALSNNFKVTLGGNRTLETPSNLADGMVLNFVIKQDGTGTRTLAYGAKYKFPGGTAPALSTTISAVDLMTCMYESAGDILCCVLQKDFK